MKLRFGYRYKNQKRYLAVPAVNVRQRQRLFVEPSSLSLSKEIERIKNHVFDIESDFRGVQYHAIEAAAKNQDVFVIAPTGSGKSLTYQIPALLKTPFIENESKTTIVVSPLKALIDDQSDKLSKIKGISVGSFHGDRKKVIFGDEANDQTDVNENMRNCKISDMLDLNFLFVTPEYLDSNISFRKKMKIKPPRRFVFDEAHAIVEWGMTFRPKYLRCVVNLGKEFPNIAWTFLTATADVGVREELKNLLENRNNNNIGGTFVVGENTKEVDDESYNGEEATHERNGHLKTTTIVSMRNKRNDSAKFSEFVDPRNERTNLSYSIRWKKDDIHHSILECIEAIGDSPKTLVYCTTIADVENVTELLRLYWNSNLDENGNSKKKVEMFHSSMKATPKRSSAFNFKQGITHVLVATSAFGMGIDIRNIRKVIHFTIPMSLSMYIQQCGRSGRDDLPAECILFYHWKDFVRAKKMSSYTSSSQSTERGDFYVEEMKRFCESPRCVKDFLWEKAGNQGKRPIPCTKSPVTCGCRNLKKQFDDINVDNRNTISTRSIPLLSTKTMELFKTSGFSKAATNSLILEKPIPRTKTTPSDTIATTTKTSKTQTNEKRKLENAVDRLYRAIKRRNETLQLTNLELPSRRVIRNLLSCDEDPLASSSDVRGLNENMINRFGDDILRVWREEHSE